MSDKSILLVDDDDDDCFLFQDALNEVNRNAELRTTSSCDQLMIMLNREADLPDLIVMDLNMPKKNGFECLECLKVTRELKNIPVVIMSTAIQCESNEQIRDRGAARYFTKPNTFEALKEIVAQLLTH